MCAPAMAALPRSAEIESCLALFLIFSCLSAFIVRGGIVPALPTMMGTIMIGFGKPGKEHCVRGSYFSRFAFDLRAKISGPLSYGHVISTM